MKNALKPSRSLARQLAVLQAEAAAHKDIAFEFGSWASLISNFTSRNSKASRTMEVPAFPSPGISTARFPIARAGEHRKGTNAELIQMGLAQGGRLKRGNQIAIRQMRTLTSRDVLRQLETAKGDEE